MEITVGAVLLASGFGRRFGGDKLLTPIEGAPLITRTFTALPPALFTRAVLTGRSEPVLALGRTAGYEAILNPGAAEGIAASLRLGLGRMEGLDGVLFAVCDQPRLTRGSVQQLLAAFSAQPDRICALSWAGVRGNPVIFPADLFGELSALTGDRGGGAVISRHPDRLLLVEALCADELRDVDRPSDL